ncbi:MAG: hypothetical protein R3362_00600, partial [Rhodothermales bacterium]|nr:hypothetical protein [Rhodothermales bacterium]
DLGEGLRQEFGEEADEAMQRVRALVAPLVALVARERTTLEDLEAQWAALREEHAALRRAVRDRYGEATV